MNKNSVKINSSKKEAIMFIGRVNEIRTLLSTYEKTNQHTIVYGNRRVGKTELVTESAKRSGLSFISYECLKSSLRKNLDTLSKQLFDITSTSDV